MMNKKTMGIAVAVLVALGIAAAAAVKVVAKKGGEGDKKPEVALVFEPREVTKPMLTNMPVTVEFSGPLVAPQTAIVRAKASGTLLTLTTAEGSRVKAGQLMGRLDSTDMDNRMAERRAMVEAARAQEAQALRTHTSNQQLADQKFISPMALDASRVALDAARANARAAQAQMGTVRAAADLAILVAPIDGIVAKRHVVAGEKLSPEQQIITLVDVRKLELAGSVGTHEVPLLKAGMLLQVMVEGVAQPIAGQLVRIAPAAEPGTRSIGVAVAIDNAGETLRAGQYGVAKATFQSDAPRMTVPVTAIVSAGGQDFVWVLEGGTIARRAVTTGLRDANAGRIEILNGVDKDVTLLAVKFDNLRDGQKASLGSTGNAAPVPSPGASAAATSAAASMPTAK